MFDAGSHVAFGDGSVQGRATHAAANTDDDGSDGDEEERVKVTLIPDPTSSIQEGKGAGGARRRDSIQ